MIHYVDVHVSVIVTFFICETHHYNILFLLGSFKTWDQYNKLPVCTLRTAFARFLDITTPPSQTLLKIISAQATKDCDKEKLDNLTNVSYYFTY